MGWESMLNWMVGIVAVVAIALMALLTVRIYMSDQPKQRASVEPEIDQNKEWT